MTGLVGEHVQKSALASTYMYMSFAHQHPL